MHLRPAITSYVGVVEKQYITLEYINILERPYIFAYGRTVDQVQNHVVHRVSFTILDIYIRI